MQKDFITHNFSTIASKLLDSDAQLEINIEAYPSYDGLASYESIYDNCGDIIKSKFPVVEIITKDENQHSITEYKFNFIRLNNEYRFFNLESSLPNPMAPSASIYWALLFFKILFKKFAYFKGIPYF